jgi:hypothetical protein
LQSIRLAADEPLNPDDGKTDEERAQEMKEKDAAAQAQILEMVDLLFCVYFISISICNRLVICIMLMRNRLIMYCLCAN